MQKDKTTERFVIVTLLNVLITVLEFIGGLVSGSLALLSDAVHNLSDVGAVVLSFIAHLVSNRKRNRYKTFGYERAETLAAFTNGVILIVISIFLFIEAVKRFWEPEQIKGNIMLIVALAGLAVNLLSMLLMHKNSRHNLNVRSTFIHMMSDALSSIAVVVGGVVIYFWQLDFIDPLLTILVSIFVMVEACKITAKAVNILMESNPSIDLNKLSEAVLAFPEVNNLHHVHIWRYSDQLIMMDAHLNVNADLSVTDLEKLYSQIAQSLKKKFGINHVTLQAECRRGAQENMIAPGRHD